MEIVGGTRRSNSSSIEGNTRVGGKHWIGSWGTGGVLTRVRRNWVPIFILTEGNDRLNQQRYQMISSNTLLCQSQQGQFWDQDEGSVYSALLFLTCLEGWRASTDIEAPLCTFVEAFHSRRNSTSVSFRGAFHPYCTNSTIVPCTVRPAANFLQSVSPSQPRVLPAGRGFNRIPPMPAVCLRCPPPPHLMCSIVPIYRGIIPGPAQNSKHWIKGKYNR